MSFFDKTLINELRKIAQQAALPDQNAINKLALKLVNNLQAQIGSNEGKITSDKDNSDLNFTNVSSLDNLFKFLNLNGIRFSNDLIAIEHQSANDGSQGFNSGQGNLIFSQLPTTKQKEYFKYPGSNDDNFDYWVNKDKLIKYLQDLFAKAKESSNELLEAAINKLITAAESALSIKVDTTAVKSTTPAEPATSSSSKETNPSPIIGMGIFNPDGTPTEAGKKLSADKVLPLERDALSFVRIVNFLDCLKDLDYVDAGSVMKIRKDISDLGQRYPLYKAGMGLTQTTGKDIVKSIVRQTGGTAGGVQTTATQLIEYLDDILEGVRTIITTMKSNEADTKQADMPGPKAFISKLNEQLNFYDNNKLYVDRWEREADEYVKGMSK